MDFPNDFPKIGDVIRLERKGSLIEGHVVGRRTFKKVSGSAAIIFADDSGAILKDGYWEWLNNIHNIQPDPEGDGGWTLTIL